MKIFKFVTMCVLSITIFTSVPVVTTYAATENTNKCETIDKKELKEICKEVSEIYNIDQYFLEAVCEKESCLNIYATNGLCKGLMQVSEKWHADRMERLGVSDIYDPYSNVLLAADYFSELFEINGDPYYALMRYNMKTATANKLYSEGIISEYALSIMERAEEIKNKDLEEKSKQRQELIALNQRALGSIPFPSVLNIAGLFEE